MGYEGGPRVPQGLRCRGGYIQYRMVSRAQKVRDNTILELAYSNRRRSSMEFAKLNLMGDYFARSVRTDRDFESSTASNPL